MIMFYAMVVCLSLRVLVPVTYLSLWCFDRPLADLLAPYALVLAVAVGAYDAVRRGRDLRHPGRVA